MRSRKQSKNLKERIIKDWTTGNYGVRELGRKHKVSHVYIIKIIGKVEPMKII